MKRGDHQKVAARERDSYTGAPDRNPFDEDVAFEVFFLGFEEPIFDLPEGAEPDDEGKEGEYKGGNAEGGASVCDAPGERVFSAGGHRGSYGGGEKLFQRGKDTTVV